MEQTRKLKPREVKWLIQGHTASGAQLHLVPRCLFSNHTFGSETFSPSPVDLFCCPSVLNSLLSLFFFFLFVMRLHILTCCHLFTGILTILEHPAYQQRKDPYVFWIAEDFWEAESWVNDNQKYLRVFNILWVSEFLRCYES